MRVSPTIVRTTLLALTAATAWLAFTPHGEAAGGRTAATGQYFQLVLDGVEVGLLKSMSSSTVTSPAAGKGKQAALVGELELQFGLGMKAPLFDWIDASLKGDRKPRAATVISFDANGNATQQTELSNALVTELTIPALDAASKTAGYFTLKLAGNVRTSPAAGAKASALSVKQKAWTTANFRLEIDGLETKRVSKIDAIAIKQAPGSAPGGALQVPTVKITASMSDIQSWQHWQELVVQEQDNHKEGTIAVLSADLKTTLAEIKLHQLGITALRTGAASSSGAVAKFDAEMYCDSLELIVPSAK